MFPTSFYGGFGGFGGACNKCGHCCYCNRNRELFGLAYLLIACNCCPRSAPHTHPHPPCPPPPPPLPPFPFCGTGGCHDRPRKPEHECADVRSRRGYPRRGGW